MVAGFSVELRGLAELDKKCALVMSDEVLNGPIRDLANYAKDRIAQYAKPHPADKGTLAAGAKIELASAGEPLGAKIGYLSRGYGMRSSQSALARAVNDGAPERGASMSVRKISGMARGLGRWGEAHGYISRATVTSKRGRPTPSPEAMALAISVAQRGTRGVGFMERAQEDTDRKADEMLRQLARELERRWAA